MPKTVPPKKNAIPLLLPKCHTFADTQSFFYSPASPSKSLFMAVKLRHPVLTARCWAGWCSARLVSPRTITWRWLDRERRCQSSCFRVGKIKGIYSPLFPRIAPVGPQFQYVNPLWLLTQLDSNCCLKLVIECHIECQTQITNPQCAVSWEGSP